MDFSYSSFHNIIIHRIKVIVLAVTSNLVNLEVLARVSFRAAAFHCVIEDLHTGGNC